MQRAREGRISVFIGGKKDVLEVHMPIFNALAETIVHVGPLGHATVAKLITNMICFVHQIAFSEGMMLGARAGAQHHTLAEGDLVDEANHVGDQLGHGCVAQGADMDDGLRQRIEDRHVDLEDVLLAADEDGDAPFTRALHARASRALRARLKGKACPRCNALWATWSCGSARVRLRHGLS